MESIAGFSWPGNAEIVGKHSLCPKAASFCNRVLQKAVESAEIHQGWRGEKEQTVQEVLNYLDGWSLT